MSQICTHDVQYDAPIYPVVVVTTTVYKSTLWDSFYPEHYDPFFQTPIHYLRLIHDIRHLTSREVVDGFASFVENTERGALVVVLVHIPEGVVLREGFASDLVPVLLGVGD